MLHAQLLQRSEIEDLLWEEFIFNHADDIVYFHSWYLDQVCEHWQAIIVTEGQKWLAILPLQIRTKFGLTYSLQPMFCKYLGLLFCREIGTKRNQYSLEQKILELSIASLPRSLFYLNASFHSSALNFLPLHWQNFTVAPRISYRLSLTGDQDYSSSITNHVKKAKFHNLHCVIKDSPETLIQLAVQRDLLTPSGILILKKLCTRLAQNQSGLLLTVEDDRGTIHSAAAFIKEKSKVFMIFSVVNNEVKGMGANALLLETAISIFKKQDVLWFYFEGSMLQNVATYIHGFRAEPILYYVVSKSLVPFTDHLWIPAFQKFRQVKTIVKTGITSLFLTTVIILVLRPI